MKRWNLEIRLGRRRVGPGHSCYVIAEIGSNHDGRFKQAVTLIRGAARAGADAVKFQSFSAEGLVVRSHPSYEILNRLELPDDWHPRLARVARDEGVDFLTTPFDEHKLEVYLATRPVAIKIASSDITHSTFIRRAAETGKPIILSTGLARLSEVRKAAGIIRAAGNPNLILLHCVSLYPPRFDELNLRAIPPLSRAIGCPVGFSDHSPGSVAPLGAVVLGACVLEKHVTLDRRGRGPDHPYATELQEFCEMVRSIRQLERALGDGIKRPTSREMAVRQEALRGLYTAQPVARGKRLTRKLVKAVRPLAPLGAQDIDRVIDRRVRADLPGDHPLAPRNLE